MRGPAGHHEAHRVAHIPQDILYPAPRYWGRAQGYAGTDAAFNDPRHAGHLHPGRD